MREEMRRRVNERGDEERVNEKRDEEESELGVR